MNGRLTKRFHRNLSCQFPVPRSTFMHLAFILLAVFLVLGALILSVRWYASEAQLQRREARAKILPPYKR